MGDAECAKCDQTFKNLGQHFRGNNDCLQSYITAYQIVECNPELSINKLGFIMKKCTFNQCPIPASNHENLKNHMRESPPCRNDLLNRNNASDLNTFF